MHKFCNCLKNISTLHNYLTYKLFASFGILVTIMLAIAFSIPQFDARESSPIDTDTLKFLRKESAGSARQYDLDEIFEQGLQVSTVNGFEIILLDPETSLFAGISPDHVKLFQAFLYKADDPNTPSKRRFDNVQFYGPFMVKSGTREYYEYFSHQVDPQEEIVNQIFDSPWLMLLILLAVSVPLLLWLSWKISRPVNELRLSANSVAAGNLSINPKLETENITEFREVGKSFNHMVQSLQDLSNHQQRMLSDISHELKTPLARLQLSTALIRRKLGELPELERIENQVMKLDTMVHDLLALSRQQVNQHLIRDIFSVNRIWDDILEDAKFETSQNGINLFVSPRITNPERYLINGNAQNLASAMENVIRNAQKYANATIKMLMYIDSEQHQLIIAIDDDGKGVPETEYQQIFRPFYRVDEARARQTGGTGLGLAIVMNAVQQHHGSVEAMKSSLGGLRVEIKLPLWME